MEKKEKYKKIKKVCGIVLITVTVILTVINLYKIYQQHLNSINYATTDAVYYERKVASETKDWEFGNSKKYVYKYYYNVNGIRYEISSDIGTDMKYGNTRKIKYNEDNPNEWTFAEYNEHVINIMYIIASFTFLGLFVLVKKRYQVFFFVFVFIISLIAIKPFEIGIFDLHKLIEINGIIYPIFGLVAIALLVVGIVFLIKDKSKIVDKKEDVIVDNTIDDMQEEKEKKTTTYRDPMVKAKNIPKDLFKNIPFEVYVKYNGDKYKEEDFYEHSQKIALKIMNKQKELYDCITEGILYQNKCWDKKIDDSKEMIKDSIKIKKVEFWYENDDINKCSNIYVYTKNTHYLLPPDMEDDESNYGYISAYFNNEEFNNGTTSAEWDY